jgi:sugar lactone lactonase YvrE
MDKEDCFYIGCLTKSGWQVQRLTKDGKFLMSFKKKEVRFEEYKGIAVDAQNNVYIVDSWNHCVHKFDQNGNFIMSFGEKQLYMPTAIAIFTFSEK